MIRPGYPKPATDKTGGALVPSLILVTLLAGLGAGLMQLQAAITRRHLHSVDTKQALYVAEAGLAEAFGAIAVGKSGNVGTPQNPALYANGVFWVEATEDAAHRIVLDSVGLYGSGRFAVSAVVQRDVNPLGVQGIHGRDSVALRAGAKVDGYDSSKGTFADQVDAALPFESTGAGAKISSGGDVFLEGDPFNPGDDTFVFGDVHPGPAGTLTADPDVFVSGGTDPLLEAVELPPIKVPPLGLNLGKAVAGSSTPLVLTGDLRYTAVGAVDGRLTIQGPARVHVDALELSGNSLLQIDASAGPVVLYVSQSLMLPAGSTVETTSADPTNTALYLGALGSDGPLNAFGERPPPSLDLGATSTFHGLLYAPRLDLEVPSNLRIFGAVAARSVTLLEGAQFTYDAAIATSPGLGVDSLPRLLSWRVIELPDDPLVKVRIDPIAQLGLRGTPPVRSYDAHKEQSMRLGYKDVADSKLLFTGDVKTVDWLLVKETETVQWFDPDTFTYFPNPAWSAPPPSGMLPVETF